MAAPVTCAKNKTIAQIFNSKTEVVPEKIGKEINPEYARLTNIVGLQKYPVEQSPELKSYYYKYVGDVKIKSGVVNLNEGASKSLNISTKHHTSDQSDVRFEVDLNGDGKRERVNYGFSTGSSPAQYSFFIIDANQPYKQTKNSAVRSLADFDKYSKMPNIDILAKTKTSDALDNLRIFDIDQDGDLDVVVSFKNPLTNKVEHFLFRNQMCMN